MSNARAVLPPPNVGDTIYVPSDAYCRHGIGDEIGGRAVVSAVTTRQKGDDVITYVTVAVFPCRHYAWPQLSQEQAELERTFKDSDAYLDMHGQRCA